MLCFAFGRPNILLDTNTRRIARRVMGEKSRQPDWQLRLRLRELAGDKGPDKLRRNVLRKWTKH